MTKTRVMLVDDHALFREGLASIISSQPDMEVVCEASDGLEAIVKASELKPDLILMDIQMPACDGLEATRKIKEQVPETTIVVLTVRDDEEKLFEAIKNGAQGYLLKTSRSREVLGMLRGAMRGEAAISPLMAGNILEEFRRLSRMEPSEMGDLDTELTRREGEVLGLVAQRLSDKEIATRLSISLYTVKSHFKEHTLQAAGQQPARSREAGKG